MLTGQADGIETTYKRYTKENIMANTTFDGPVRSKNGFQSIGPGAVPALTAATDLTVADHAGRVLTMDPV